MLERKVFWQIISYFGIVRTLFSVFHPREHSGERVCDNFERIFGISTQRPGAQMEANVLFIHEACVSGELNTEDMQAPL